MAGFTLKNLDVALQDQTTPSLCCLFSRLLGAVTLAAPGVVGSYTVTLVAGHGAQAGELLIFSENNFALYTVILNVNVNTITVDSPLDAAFTTSATVTRNTTALNVKGDVDAVTFRVTPPNSAIWDVTRIMITITDNAEMDSAKFGGIVALTRGIVLRQKGTRFIQLGNAKANGEFAAKGWDLTYDTKAPAGSYGLTMLKQYAGQNAVGVVVRLDGSTGDELQFIVQDDLTALSSMTAAINGHVVVP